MPKPPGGRDNTIVKGSNGTYYVADKKGKKLTPLSDADKQKMENFIAKAEEELSKLFEGTPFMAGGVNLCVQDIFPGEDNK